MPLYGGRLRVLHILLVRHGLDTDLEEPAAPVSNGHESAV